MVIFALLYLNFRFLSFTNAISSEFKLQGAYILLSYTSSCVIVSNLLEDDLLLALFKIILCAEMTWVM